MSAKQVIRSGVGGIACGIFLYIVGDTANDLYVYSVLHSQALKLAEENEEVAALVGSPFQSGAWYNATLGFSHRDHVAHCSFQLTGNKRTTDIAVKGGREASSYRSMLLYNLLGPGTWKLLSCQAMVPGVGGLAKPLSLLPEHQDQKQQQQQQDSRLGRVGAVEPSTATATQGGRKS